MEPSPADRRRVFLGLKVCCIGRDAAPSTHWREVCIPLALRSQLRIPQRDGELRVRIRVQSAMRRSLLDQRDQRRMIRAWVASARNNAPQKIHGSFVETTLGQKLLCSSLRALERVSPGIRIWRSWGRVRPPEQIPLGRRPRRLPVVVPPLPSLPGPPPPARSRPGPLLGNALPALPRWTLRAGPGLEQEVTEGRHGVSP